MTCKMGTFTDQMLTETVFTHIPCLATMTLDTASGTLVPAAKNVIPITESGIFSVSPMVKDKNIQ